jgi:YD repeat-containing protein
LRSKYDDAGRREKLTLPNGAYTVYAYDTAGRLLSVMNRKSDGSVISSFDYTVDSVGNREDMTQVLGGTQQFNDWTYDDLYRLKDEVRRLNDSQGSVVAEQHFTYDGVRNRLTHSAESITGAGESVFDDYDAANQLTQVARRGLTRARRSIDRPDIERPVGRELEVVRLSRLHELLELLVRVEEVDREPLPHAGPP